MAIIRIPALIDPHIHAVESSKASWQQLAQVAQRVGYGALQIMPDLDPPLTDKITLAYYRELTDKTTIPLFFAQAGTPTNIEDIKQAKGASAIKVWLGTGPEDLIVTKEEDLRQILLATDKVVMIHAEDETTLLQNYHYGQHELSLERHAEIFNRATAIRATIKAITAAKETGRRVYICHISTAEEVELIRQAKAKGIRVYAEVAPHHLFLNENDLDRLGLLGKVNPPLRQASDQQALWEGITDRTIDTIGTDTSSWYQTEKEVAYEDAPSGLPNLEITLALLLTAVKERRLTLSRVVELTSLNPGRIFSIPRPNRSLFVDLDNPRAFKPQLSDWHPYNVDQLVGWPVRQKDEH